ncbi:MAG: formate acetyltransferase, partial [Deltaproteobacteria bacterium HGW-Deltaproteobacteria-2]
MAEPATNASIKDLEKKQEWWWAAEKKRSKRLDYLRKAIWKKGAIGGNYPVGLHVDLEQGVLHTQAARDLELAPDPPVVKFAKLFAYYLDHKTIFITDKAQLVGYVGSLPNTVAWNPTVATLMNIEVLNDSTIIPEPLDDSLKVLNDIIAYWSGKADADRMIPYADMDDVSKILSGTIGWGVPLARGGYSGKDYEYIMTGKRGFADVIDEIDQQIDKADAMAHMPTANEEITELYEKMNYWEAMKIALEAGIRHGQRFARLARLIAENFETDNKRKEELLQLANCCERVPAKTPRTLQESFQYDLFIQLFSRSEAIEGAWPARPDYYHGPYYDKDVNIDKSLTKEEAMDLVGEFLIRAAEISQFKVKMIREGLQGIEGTWVWTLGGVNKDGSDACNDLTTGQGLGYPSMRNDPILIANSMHWHGHPIEEARTWVHQACMSPCPTTKRGFQPMRMANATANCAKIIEYVFTRGFDPVVNMQIGAETPDPATFTSYEQVYDAWILQMKTIFSILTRMVNMGRKYAPRFTPRPFLSGISERSVESGMDVNEPSISQGNSWITAFTWVENIDSLAAIKKLVFDEKKYTMAELSKAIATDWQGQEEMRLDFVRNAPKWGNDDDYVDSIMLKCLRDIAVFAHELRDPMGNTWPILPENVSGNIHYANVVGALPSGRR